MLPKEDRKAMLLRLYNDDSPLMDHSKDRFMVRYDHDAPDSPMSEERVIIGQDGTVMADTTLAGTHKAEDEGTNYEHPVSQSVEDGRSEEAMDVDEVENKEEVTDIMD